MAKKPKIHWPAVAYALSSGWAATFSSSSSESPKGTKFEWREVEWEIEGYFKTPCCHVEIALVRRVGSDLQRWAGLGCPKCESDETYTIETEFKA